MDSGFFKEHIPFSVKRCSNKAGATHRGQAAFPRIRFVNQKLMYIMQAKLICFIFLGYIFRGVHSEDLECICACCSPPLYAPIHTPICEPIKQALTTHVNCVPHNKLYAYLQKKIHNCCRSPRSMSPAY